MTELFDEWMDDEIADGDDGTAPLPSSAPAEGLFIFTEHIFHPSVESYLTLMFKNSIS